MVERAIKTVKSLFIKTKRSNGVLNLATIEYNNNPKENLYHIFPDAYEETA